jgi:hypothetical protein
MALLMTRLEFQQLLSLNFHFSVANPAVRKEDIDYAIAEMDRLGAQL